MDGLRNMISNLYIYKFQNFESVPNRLNINSVSKKDDSLFNDDFNDKSLNAFQESPIIPERQKPLFNSKINNKIFYHNNISKNNRSCNRLDNINREYIILKNNGFSKQEVNYVLKNKELIKEQEILMKEMKQKKENEALNLLLSYKSKNSNGVRPRIFDYELKQKQKLKKNRVVREKKEDLKLRNFSSQKPLRKRKNDNIFFCEENNHIDYQSAGEEKEKVSSKSIKLPPIKPSTSPLLEGLPILHKDYGKLPEYLEKRKKEIQEQKELEKIKQKEKLLPKGSRILPESERQERLAELNNMKKELEDELYKLPIARLSKRQIARKEEIEKSLFDIDEKLQRFVGYKEVIVKI